MNIWVIGRSYPMEKNNRQGAFEYEQAKMLSQHGNQVAYLACVFHPFKKVKKWGFCSWKEDKLSVFTYSQFYTIERMKLHFEPFQKAVWNKFLKKVEDNTGTPDIIHVHYPANITIASMILDYQKKGTKIVCTEHWNQVLRKVIDNYEKKQLKKYADHANAFLCVGKPLKDAVIELTGTKRELYIVPNVVNSIFRIADHKHNGFRFIAVGVAFEHKQFDKIISAFASVFGGKEGFYLTIVGDGPALKNLNKQVEKLKIGKQVHLTGRLSHEETAKKIKNSDVLVCYSKYETFGVPVIEAWASGIPVIASTATAAVEKWDDQLGIEVSFDDLQALKNAMSSVYKNYSEYDKKALSDFAKGHYSEDVICKKLINIYSNA